MNPNQSCKFWLIFSVFLCSTALSGVISPLESEKREILTINEKRRTYYQLHNEPLNYQIKGPRELTLYARKAVPKHNKKLHGFGYQIGLDDGEPVLVSHEKALYSAVKSGAHPGHSYTSSGKYIIKIPAGHHTLTLAPLKPRSGPVLIRIIASDPPDKENGIFLAPSHGEDPVHLRIAGKKIRYFELLGNQPLNFYLDGPVVMEVRSRLAFLDWMGPEEPYRIRVKLDGVPEGTFFFTADKSDATDVMEDKTIVPGKWRSCDIRIPQGAHNVTLELLNRDKKVYVRCKEYKPAAESNQRLNPKR